MKYIIVDLDDTLLRSDKSISEYTIDVLNKVRAKGYLLIFNTARSYKSCKPYMELIRPDFSILNGGVEIANKDMEIIYRDEVDKDTTNRILNLLKSSSDVLSYSIQNDELYSNDLPFIEKNKLAKYFAFNRDLDEGAFKIMASSKKQDYWRNLAKELGLEFETYWHGTWFRFSKATKYDGNLKLYEILNDNNPITYAFGDDTGDLMMLKEATVGVALLNSHHNVLKEIKNVTKYDHDNDGVAHYIMDNLLGEL